MEKETSIINGISYESKPMPILFYQRTSKYLFGLVRKDRFDTRLGASAYTSNGVNWDRQIRRRGKDSLLYNMSSEYLDKHRFFVIRRDGGDYFQYIVEYDKHKRKLDKPKVVFTKDVMKAYVSSSSSDITDTIQTIRSSGMYKVYVESIYLNVENELAKPDFLILVCDTSERKIYYASKYLTYNQMKTCATLDNAQRFDYDSAVSAYEGFTKNPNYKGYKFAIIKRPKSDVRSYDIEEYHKTHRVSGSVQVGFTLASYHRINQGKNGKKQKRV